MKERADIPADDKNIKKKFYLHDRIFWILLVTVLWYMIIFSMPLDLILFDSSAPLFFIFGVKTSSVTDPFVFVIVFYLSTLPAFIGAFVYTRLTKRNRFIFDSFLPRHGGNTIGKLLLGFLAGFVMNFSCIAAALIHGDFSLYLDFAASQIPFFLFAFLCVFIQSSAEELWCRGFVYERVNVRYPLWVSILVNGLFFAALHIMNPGSGFLPILDIFICGISFSLAKWYTRSIWFPMGIHTAWNFTQNFLFGLPNSGLASAASVFHQNVPAGAASNLIYDQTFGVEGAVPAIIADAVLGAVCLILAAKQGRLGELKMSRTKSEQTEKMVLK